MKIESSFFDTVYERRGTNSLKYDCFPTDDPDVIQMWVADMDFRTAPAICEALKKTVEHGIFGYGIVGEEYDKSVIGWYKRRMNWEIKESQIIKAPGVLFAIAAAVRALSEEGDGVLICQPVYHPFAELITDNRRNIVISELRLKDGKYEPDFEDIEEKIKENSVKIFLLCSPHNPAGRVWKREELTEIGRICLKHNVKIISDEIHSDFIFCDRPHLPIAALSEDLANITVTCTSPTKTFNIAGIQAANIIISNREMRRKVSGACSATFGGELSIMAETAVKAAYNYGEEWLDELLKYIRGNFDLLSAAFPKDGEISLIQPEGTYLAWIDCSRALPNLSNPEEFFLKNAKVRVHNGSLFGKGGEGFIRLNTACPRVLLAEAVNRIKQAVKD